MSDSTNNQQEFDLDDREAFEGCLAVYMAGMAEENDLRLLERWIAESDWAREEYLRHAETEAMLQWQHGPVKNPIEFKPEVRPSTVARAERQSSRRTFFQILGVCAAVLTIVFTAWWNRGQQPPPSLSIEAQLAANWNVRSTPGARYTVVSRDQLKLDQGELFVTPSSKDQPLASLNIETPFGKVSSGEGTFYVGTHPNLESQSSPGLTRVLVIGGDVKLTNKLGSVDGNADDLLTANSGSSPETLALRSNNEFALELYKKIRKQKGNLFVSPYSISQSLMLALEGARGKTAEEIGRLLHLPEVARRTGANREEIPWRTSLLHTGVAQIRQRMSNKDNAEVKQKRKRIANLKEKIDKVNVQLRKLESERKWRELAELSQEIQSAVNEHNESVSQIDQYELRIGNAMWVEKEYGLNADFKDVVEQFYTEGAIFPVDFRNRPEEVREEINSWAEKQTNNRISNVLPPESINSSTALVMANAIYFRGEWVQPFEPGLTKDSPFTLGDSSQVSVPLMHAPHLGSCRFGSFHRDGSFYETPRKVPLDEKVQTDPGPDGFAILELPYKGDDVQMLLLAPNDPAKLADVEALLSVENLERWNRELVKRSTHVFLPKFELDEETNLNSVLQDMGMRNAFRNPAIQDGADFSGVTNTTNELFINAVRHKAILQVNEKGTEAAAVTVVFAADSEVPRKMVPFTPTFRADRPFCFLIRNKATGTILFMGRYVDPAVNN